MKKFQLSIFLSLLWALIPAQDNSLPSFIADSLDSYITSGMRDWRIPGMSVAIVKDGQVVYMKGFGTTEVDGSEKVDENTIFMIGSNTKAFTATALAILQASGVVNLHDQVQTWMPEFQLNNTLASEQVNIIDLLSHRLGFETFQGDFTYWTSTLTRSEVIGRLAIIEPRYGFREKWGYCNAAYVAAGELIPRIINRSWEETVRDSILVPLGMTRTIVLTDQFEGIPNTASAHTIVDNRLVKVEIPDINNLAPAGSMSSSASDMSKWLLTQLNDGELNGVQVIPSLALQAIREPASIVYFDPADGAKTHFHLYGLGLVINDRDGRLVYSHTGGVNGFLSSVMFIPEEKLGIVVLTNSDQNHLFINLTHEIRDAFLDLPYQGYSDRSFVQFQLAKSTEVARTDSLKAIVAKHNNPSFPLDNYSGTYYNPVYGKITLTAENDLLKISFSNHPHLTATLEHLQNDVFLCTYSDPTFGIVEIPFHIENDKVTGLTLTVADFVEFTPYEFLKME